MFLCQTYNIISIVKKIANPLVFDQDPQRISGLPHKFFVLWNESLHRSLNASGWYLWDVHTVNQFSLQMDRQGARQTGSWAKMSKKCRQAPVVQLGPPKAHSPHFSFFWHQTFFSSPGVFLSAIEESALSWTYFSGTPVRFPVDIDIHYNAHTKKTFIKIQLGKNAFHTYLTIHCNLVLLKKQ